MIFILKYIYKEKIKRIVFWINFSEVLDIIYVLYWESLSLFNNSVLAFFKFESFVIVI